LLEVASGPWHPAQLVEYRVVPSSTGAGVGVGTGFGVGTGTGGVAGLRAVTSACISAADSVERFPMPPMFPPIAFCRRTTVTPFLLVVARLPWHPAQLAAKSAAPSSGVDGDGAGVGDGVGVGVGVGVLAVRRSVTAWMSAAESPLNIPMPPRLEAIAL
jgi:hypothetical protein